MGTRKKHFHRGCQIMPSTLNNVFIYSGFLLLGVCQTLPWNCFINTYNYLILQLSYNKTEFLENPEYENNTLQTFWSSFVGLVINGVQIVSTITNLLIIKRINRNARIYPALTTAFISFGVIAVMTSFSIGANAFFGITLMLALTSQFGTGISQACCFGLAAMTGPSFISGLFLGQSLAGSLTAGLSILTQAVYPDKTEADYNTSALLYFTIASIVSFLAIPSFYLLDKRTQQKNESEHEKIKDEEYAEKSVMEDLQIIISDIIYIGKAIKYQATSLLLVFAVTLCVFPVITERVESECITSQSDSAYCRYFGSTQYFLPVTCFLLINLADFSGRFLAGKFQLIGLHNDVGLLCAALFRIVVAAGFFLTRRDNFVGLGIMGSDWAYIVLMIIFGVSGGYVANLCFMYGPQRVNPDKEETAGSLLPLYLCVGLLIGSLASFGL